MVNLDETNAAARRIREAVPLAGETTTNAEAGARHRLGVAELKAMGVVETGRAWGYVRLESGKITGRWGESLEESALWCAVWWAEPVALVSHEPITDSEDYQPGMLVMHARVTSGHVGTVDRIMPWGGIDVHWADNPTPSCHIYTAAELRHVAEVEELALW